MKLISTIKRLVINSDRTAVNTAATAAAVANLSDLLNEKSGAIAAAIANQSDLINQKNGMLAAAVANQTDLLNEKCEAIATAVANQTDLVNEKSEAIARAIANQTDLINDKTNVIAEAIANQSDLIRRKCDSMNKNLETLVNVMTELRQIQKAQLLMQRNAAEAIKQSTAAAPSSVQPPKMGPDGEYPVHGIVKPASERLP